MAILGASESPQTSPFYLLFQVRNLFRNCSGGNGNRSTSASNAFTRYAVLWGGNGWMPMFSGFHCPQMLNYYVFSNSPRSTLDSRLHTKQAERASVTLKNNRPAPVERRRRLADCKEGRLQVDQGRPVTQRKRASCRRHDGFPQCSERGRSLQGPE